MVDSRAELASAYAAAARALAAGENSDPFGLLGPHTDGGAAVVRTFQPGARAVELVCQGGETVPMSADPAAPGLFSCHLGNLGRYRLRIHWAQTVHEIDDPYAFGVLLDAWDLGLFSGGGHAALGRCFGAMPMNIDGVDGVRFAVWAPNARRVSVVGDFNSWDGRRHPMRCRYEAGVWELFIPGLRAGERYKFEILGQHGLLPQKADPMAWAAELPPASASIVVEHAAFEWSDEAWMAQRARSGRASDAAMSIYEVHAASWKRPWGPGETVLHWDELTEQLIPYVRDMGFTHIELLPITLHPFGGSWGYQPLGLYAPQPDFGSPAAFARFVDACHRAGIGVLLDWVPAHFPTDAHGLARFDGTALYEHADPREGFHRDWNTLIYNFGRNEVRSFLLSSALHWLQQYHLDGLRVDAVASMLYRDYSRNEGEWIPNRYGGRENLEAVEFLRQLNTTVARECPGALMIAEESTAWPGVTHPVESGGLGFSYKWNMGWMHDTLLYIGKNPVHRSWEHDRICFGLIYAFSEQFILPLSHDEVVHGKGSLLGRMPGDAWQRFANLRAYLAFMWAHPGKKLLFMGGELAQGSEWYHGGQLDWAALSDPQHAGVQALVRQLNRLYCGEPALHQIDARPEGFRWLIGDDAANSVYAFYRSGEGDEVAPVIAVCNFTPVPREAYRIGAPRAGFWRECINTDSVDFGGSNMGNSGGVEAVAVPSHGQPYSLVLTLPPLSTLLLVAGG
ncbi:1,4-alpha-glucan branching enzyme [Plasticicumulans acidivorans]|uniref:1,4-alpha-glucan branching enzyme GlgB n=1 Tax=Plasticicumulans acidivorans TaxID=886464 RepID=A0A317N071_9GAMM|nr:1,4-alpha-glucan branching protein GlgB [Plasticicumulans acidivorans]PWV65962.1 1,4-alpha-glucan branching enzyme [Plasticicumulans acidivorans]